MSFPIDNKFRILKASVLEADNLAIPGGGALSVDILRQNTLNGDLAIQTSGSGKVKISGTKFPSTLGSNKQVLKNNGSNELTWSSDVIDETSSQTLTNKTISFSSNTMTNVVSTNTDQTITGNKLLTGGLKTDINTGYLALRDSNVSSFLHTISYDTTSAAILLATSEDSGIYTGMILGYKSGNIKSNATISKFGISYLSGSNTTTLNVEGTTFLTEQNNRHTLTNVNSINLNGGSSKTCTLITDANQLNQNNTVYMPLNTNVELKYLEGMSGANIQPQINGKIDASSNQTVTGTLTFEKAQNNTNNIILNNTIGSVNGLAITNAFSPNSLRILKDSDDFSIVINNLQRMKVSGDNLDLTNGGEYRISGAALKNVSEILTNKTISFASNTLTNVVSTNTDQNITSKKTCSNTEPFVFVNATESKLSYSGINNYSLKMNVSGYDFYDESSSKSMMTIGDANGVNVTTVGKLRYNGEIVHFKRQYSSSAPTVNDDGTQGYSIGSKWFNSTNKSKYECTDISTGAAVWDNKNWFRITLEPSITGSLTYSPVAFIMVGYNYYNKLHIISESDGDHKIELYNVSTASIIMESSNINYPTPNLTTINIPGSPIKFPPLYTFRISSKIVTGTFATVYSIAFE